MKKTIACLAVLLSVSFAQAAPSSKKKKTAPPPAAAAPAEHAPVESSPPVIQTYKEEPTQKAFHLGLLTGITWVDSTVPDGTPAASEPSAGAGFTLGLSGELPLSQTFSLELDALFLKVKQEVGTGTAKLEASSSELLFPLIARYHVVPMFSIGFGGYGGFVIGDTDVTTAAGTSSVASASDSDFGLVGSLRGKLELDPTLSLVLDGRYYLGLTEQRAGVKSRSIQALVGIAYGF